MEMKRTNASLSPKTEHALLNHYMNITANITED
jgi:hypothetical protein